MSGRGQNPHNRGGRYTGTAGYPRDDRDSRRAYDYQQRNRQPSEQWADEQPYEPPENNDKRKQRNKQRQNEYKKQQKLKAGEKKPPAPVEAEKATNEDQPVDAPLYDTTPFAAGVPINQEYCQNFDFSGFIPLCSETYGTLQTLNPRLTRDMPYPGFLHNMNVLLQTAMLDSVFENGQRPIPGQDSRAQDFLPSEYVVPGPIYEYISSISTVLTPGNQEVKVNIPEAVIPQEAYEDEQGNQIPAGTFGPVDAEDHNAYEINVCPYTTMTYVIESSIDRQQNQIPENWNPLPPELAPEGGQPTQDFLVYLPIPALHTEGKESLRIGIFEDNDSIAGRVRFNAALFAKCNGELTKLGDKFKMVRLGFEKGTRKYVKFKSDPGNLIFVEALDPTPPLSSRVAHLMYHLCIDFSK